MRTETTAINDPFFAQDSCDRCFGRLSIRTMSWFNKDCICMNCSDKEKGIKDKLRTKGIQDAMEGCGFIPDPDKVEPC